MLARHRLRRVVNALGLATPLGLARHAVQWPARGGLAFGGYPT